MKPGAYHVSSHKRRRSSLVISVEVEVERSATIARAGARRLLWRESAAQSAAFESTSKWRMQCADWRMQFVNSIATAAATAANSVAAAADAGAGGAQGAAAAGVAGMAGAATAPAVPADCASSCCSTSDVLQATKVLVVVVSNARPSCLPVPGAGCHCREGRKKSIRR